MFERPHHQAVALALYALDGDLLAQHRCWFGGGTAIALRHGEFRESVDIDLMVSDVVMPEMDGPALLVKVRERLPNLKVIFVSGYAEESVRQDIADDQSVEFLAKPYSLDQINSKVKEVLGKGAQTIQ